MSNTSTATAGSKGSDRAYPENSFVVISPDGMFYWPPIQVTEAKDFISKRSLYSGEPGWEIVPLWLALDHENSGLREVH